MRRILLAISGLTLLIGAAGRAEAQNAAGVIAYFRAGETTYLLLADHTYNDRGWASFGGGIEEGESVLDAALREFSEETRCIFRPEDISKRIIETNRVDRNGFSSYIVEVDYVPVFLFSSEETIRKCSGPDSEERGPYAWVPLSEVLTKIASQNGDPLIRLDPQYLPSGARDHLFDEFAAVLALAREKKLLPDH